MLELRTLIKIKMIEIYFLEKCGQQHKFLCYDFNYSFKFVVPNSVLQINIETVVFCPNV